jgi:predicted hydrocarbon binding protein
MQDRRYAFSWDMLGNIALGRPNLGPSTRLEVYRLMQFALRDILEQRFGTEEVDEIYRQAGRIAGRTFSEKVIGPVADLHEYLRKLQVTLRDYSIGIVRVEEMSPDGGRLVLTVEEDLDCSGLPELDFETCKFDEGFIAGLLEFFNGRTYRVTEIDCWCTGARVCRFIAEVVAPE